MITKHVPFGRIALNSRSGWRTEAVGDPDLGLSVLGLLADRDLGHEQPYEPAADSKGLLRAGLGIICASPQRVEPGLGTDGDLCLLPLLRQLPFDGI